LEPGDIATEEECAAPGLAPEGSTFTDSVAPALLACGEVTALKYELGSEEGILKAAAEFGVVTTGVVGCF
jgi:hypothetical protein